MALKRKHSGSKDGEMSFLEHLEELRWHIIRSVLAIVILMIAAFIFKNFIFDMIILAPKNPGFFTNRVLCELGHLVNMPALCINSVRAHKYQTVGTAYHTYCGFDGGGFDPCFPGYSVGILEIL